MGGPTQHAGQYVTSQGPAGSAVLDAVARVTRQFVYVFSLDTDVITYGDRSVLRELGHTVPSDLPIAMWAHFVHPDDRNQLRHLQRHWSTRQDDAVREGEYRIRDVDGAYRWFLARETVMARHADGTVSHVLGALIDVTEIKHSTQAERALRDSEAQLRQSQKLHAIGQLAGGVAHDFNNLLTVIMGYADTILANVESSHRLFEAASHIRDAGERAALLTRQLLHFGRKAILEPRALDFNTAIRNSGTMLGRLIGEDVSVVTVLAPSLSLARVDRGQFEQVIINLCLNARDAMPQGGRITIETKNASFDEHDCRIHPAYKPGEFVELSIADTGTGMIAEVMSHLFEPFFTTKGQGKGTGLGLATVYGIVQQAGGFITVDSRPGCGSVFRVFVPTIAEQEPRAPVELGPPPHGRETVLLVEDEDGVRRLARLSLEQHGYTVLEANGGRAAIELSDAHDGPIALLLSDVVMPELNGREVSERLLARRPRHEGAVHERLHRRRGCAPWCRRLAGRVSAEAIRLAHAGDKSSRRARSAPLALGDTESSLR